MLLTQFIYRFMTGFKVILQIRRILAGETFSHSLPSSISVMHRLRFETKSYLKYFHSSLSIRRPQPILIVPCIFFYLSWTRVYSSRTKDTIKTDGVTLSERMLMFTLERHFVCFFLLRLWSLPSQNALRFESFRYWTF